MTGRCLSLVCNGPGQGGGHWFGARESCLIEGHPALFSLFGDRPAKINKGRKEREKKFENH